MAHELRMKIIGQRAGVIFENVVEAKTPIPKSAFVNTWLGSRLVVNHEIEYLKSIGLVEYADKRKTKLKPTEKALKVYGLINDLAIELEKKYGKAVMEKLKEE